MPTKPELCTKCGKPYNIMKGCVCDPPSRELLRIGAEIEKAVKTFEKFWAYYKNKGYHYVREEKFMGCPIMVFRKGRELLRVPLKRKDIIQDADKT